MNKMWFHSITYIQALDINITKLVDAGLININTSLPNPETARTSYIRSVDADFRRRDIYYNGTFICSYWEQQ